MPTLQNDTDLAASAVVANNAMNRERGCAGANSYERDLGLDPAAFLAERCEARGSVAWLDICCGRGRALAEAARRLSPLAAVNEIILIGIDLVPAFDPMPEVAPTVRLLEANAILWEPGRTFDLITCTHGLHYVGDKLGVISRACSWLTEDGIFRANLDLDNVCIEGAPGRGGNVARVLRAAGLDYDARRHMMTCRGRSVISFAYTYLGADDSAGPNYTGQPAVDSWYVSPDRSTGPDSQKHMQAREE